jgi:hypothetical protein
MAEYLIQDTTLDAIADAINAKTGKSAAMTPAEMVTEIESIETGGGGDTETLDFLLSCIDYTISGDVVLPSGIKKIVNANNRNGWVFYNNANITSLVVPNTVEEWQTLICYAMSNLRTAVISMSAPSVPQDWFWRCSKMHTFEITEECGLISLPKWAFEECTALASVILRPKRVVGMSTNDVFSGATNFQSGGVGKVYVPDSLVDSYKAATNWSVYAEHIVPLSTYVESE